MYYPRTIFSSPISPRYLCCQMSVGLLYQVVNLILRKGRPIKYEATALLIFHFSGTKKAGIVKRKFQCSSKNTAKFGRTTYRSTAVYGNRDPSRSTGLRISLGTVHNIGAHRSANSEYSVCMVHTAPTLSSCLKKKRTKK